MTKNNDKEWIVTPGLINEVKRFENLYNIAKDLPIMICGPTGVGKSLFIHIFRKLFIEEYGKKAKDPVRLNCAAFGKDIILSELFGHVKGAFSGAHTTKKGHIEKADGGVLILEEIGVIPERGQEQLLTFIEDGYYFKLGGIERQHAKVRIIATTNKTKEDFREDFWHRFFPFYVPPLHKRRMDLLYYLAKKFPGITLNLMPKHVLMLLCYNWPGNVRELEKVALMINWELENEKTNLAERGLIQYAQNIFAGKGNNMKPPLSLKIEEVFSHTSTVFNHSDYTSLGSSKIVLLETSLRAFGVNVDLLNSILEMGCLSLNAESKKRPFKNNDDLEWRKNAEIEKRLGVHACLQTEIFETISFIFEVYCMVFLQHPHMNHNLIDVKENYFAYYILDMPDINLPFFDKKYFGLRKNLFEFVTQTKIPDHIKTFPFPDINEKEIKEITIILKELELKKGFHQYSDGDEELKTTEKVIAKMSGPQLEKLHNETLMKRAGGNISQAAKLKGLSDTGFRKRLEKYNPDTLSP
jgi:transcriptional regulator with AAA-type ATPase domain